MIMHRSDQALAIHALKSAAPYIRMYKGKTFILKAGGGVFAEAQATRLLIEQIALLHHFGVRVVLVHGGGPQLTELGAALGVPARMVDGRRITDEKSIELIAMVLNGLINTRVLGICRALNIEAVGVSGVDAGLVRAHRRPPVRGSAGGELIDFGFGGDIDAVDGTVLRKLLDNGLMPVVSPLSADDSGTLLNINADTVAAAIGASLQAEKLILCTGAPGILASVDDPRSLVSYTDLAGLKRLRDEGRIADGMLPKALAIENAIRGGVRRVHVVSYRSPEGLLAVPDLEAIRAGLLGLAESHARGEWRIELADEDGQTALERRLTERIGPAGGRIHLGRSRNDQVLAALRLYLLETLDALSTGVLAVAAALDELAARERRTVIPGYTHLQQAMPSSVPLWAGGFAAELRDDAAALTQARRRLDKNPLGSAAGYGTPGLPVDREATRTALGFAAVQEPVTAVQLSRGKGEAQLIFEIALLMQDLSRFAA